MNTISLIKYHHECSCPLGRSSPVLYPKGKYSEDVSPALIFLDMDGVLIDRYNDHIPKIKANNEAIERSADHIFRYNPDLSLSKTNFPVSFGITK